MNLSAKLLERAAGSGPVRVGLIGAGKFGSMVLSQAQKIKGLHVVGVVDLNVGRAREAMQRVGWPQERYTATSMGEAVRKGTTCVTDDVAALMCMRRRESRPQERRRSAAAGGVKGCQW